MYKDFDEMPVMLSVPEAAEVLGISAVSLYKLIRNDNSFPVVAMGRRKSVPKEQLKICTQIKPMYTDEYDYNAFRNNLSIVSFKKWNAKWCYK